MEWLKIVFGLLYAVFLFWNILSDDTDGRVCSVFLLTLSVIILVTLISSDENKNTPTALDVYEGKTTLQITYEDSIPIDTVIVFKPEFRK